VTGAPSPLRRVAVLILLALLVAPVAARARVVERVAAVVGDSLVLASEVEDRVGPLMADVNRITDPDKRSARATALRREVLERLIDDELIYQQAAELKLSISSEQVDASIEEIKKQNNLTDDQLREALRGQGMTMAAYRSDLKRQLLRFRVLNIAVGSRVNISDDEVRAYYERHMKDGSNVQVRASHVYFAIPEGADAAAAAEKQAQAQKILERAQAGEDFAKLARETSDDAATRADGGDLGYFGKDMLPKAIEELVFSMKVGEVRGPIRVDRGFHVIKLVDRKVKDPKPFDEAGRHPLLIEREAVDVEAGRRRRGRCAAAVELNAVEHHLLWIEAPARIGRHRVGEIHRDVLPV
jgi:peptidyl-prolyl cis-trans isomerase SurA